MRTLRFGGARKEASLWLKAMAAPSAWEPAGTGTVRTELLQKALELERQSGIRGVLTSEVMGPDGGDVSSGHVGLG